jgi:hypothetical protein
VNPFIEGRDENAAAFGASHLACSRSFSDRIHDFLDQPIVHNDDFDS